VVIVLAPTAICCSGIRLKGEYKIGGMSWVELRGHEGRASRGINKKGFELRLKLRFLPTNNILSGLYGSTSNTSAI
jgi:hypothetical protein